MDADDARLLAQRLLSAELPTRWAHVQQVAALAGELATAAGVSQEPASSAAWLHDIGYASVLADTGFHPIDGARFLRDQGWPASVYNLVAHHSCAVIEADRRGLRAILADEFIDDPGLSRDILWAADATTGPDGTRLTIQARVSEVVERYGAGTLVADCMLAIQPALVAALHRVETATGRRQPT